jgi:hypothetical protein
LESNSFTMQTALDPVEKLVAIGLGAVFLLLGGLFTVLPDWGALLFGIDPPQGEGLSYVRAIGFRDLALGLYVAGLAVWSDRRALCIVLALTTIIPVMDFALLLVLKGPGAIHNLALHGTSAAIFAGMASWVALRQGDPRDSGQDRQ